MLKVIGLKYNSIGLNKIMLFFKFLNYIQMSLDCADRRFSYDCILPEFQYYKIQQENNSRLMI